MAACLPRVVVAAVPVYVQVDGAPAEDNAAAVQAMTPAAETDAQVCAWYLRCMLYILCANLSTCTAWREWQHPRLQHAQ